MLCCVVHEALVKNAGNAAWGAASGEEGRWRGSERREGILGKQTKPHTRRWRMAIGSAQPNTQTACRDCRTECHCLPSIGPAARQARPRGVVLGAGLVRRCCHSLIQFRRRPRQNPKPSESRAARRAMVCLSCVCVCARCPSLGNAASSRGTAAACEGARKEKKRNDV